MQMIPDETTIAIMGEDVPARHEIIPIEKLKFLPDNPRVYAVIRDMEDFLGLTPEEKQDRIYECLLKEPSVKKLIPEIKRDRGLQEPIIVRWDTQEVIEGNSRLAVYRKLLNENPNEVHWKEIRCLVVSSLTDDQQTRLLGQIHLHGKTEWSRYARALYCYRWVEEQERDPATLAPLSGLTAAEIKKNVKTIKLMQENDDNNLSNYSYYDVLVRNRAISSAIDDSSTLRDTLLSKIKTKDFTAQEMRDRLPTIIGKLKILRKFEKGEVTLKDAYDRASISGAQHRLRKIREGLEDIEKEDIEPLEHNEIKAVEQVLRKIRRELGRVSGMVSAKLST